MRGKFAKAAEIAAGQMGRVTWQQLVDEGIHRHTIQRWIEDGRLHELHHGVYAAGHAGRSTAADYMAALLACGEGAILSHFAAAYVLRLLPRRAPPPPETTVPTLAGLARPGIVIHRVARLHHLDTCTFEGLRLATAPRALLDIAPALDPPLITRACHEAWIHHRTSPHHIEQCIARNPHRPGAAKLRRAAGADVTLSALEDAFLALLRERGLPAPRTNVDRRGDKVDCHWPERGLTVELLSYRFHGSRRAFEDDVARRRRSSHLAFTYGDVVERADATVAELAAALGAHARR